MENFRQFIYDKCLDFAVRMIRLTRYLQDEKHEYVASKQVCRSGEWNKHRRKSGGSTVWNKQERLSAKMLYMFA